jgi:hypothetical protein
MGTKVFGDERAASERLEGIGDDDAAQPGDSGEAAEQPGAVSQTPEQPGGDGGAARPTEAIASEASKRRDEAKQRREAKRLKRDKARDKAREYARTHKKADATSSRKAATQATIDLTHVLYSLHRMGAVFLQSPDFVITEEEAKLLADAIRRVSDLYEIPLLDEKARAWLNLGMAGTEVYGTRIAAAIIDRKRRKPKIIHPFDTPRADPNPRPDPATVEGVPDGMSHANHA